jgi:predicted metal-dependent enzyme (double-stranded beta helix superfamily)
MRTTTPRPLLGLASDIAARRDLWPDELRFDPHRRWYARLATEPGVEAWLLTWLPGQRTGLHDHSEAAGAFVVVEGALRETTVVPRPGGGVRDVVRVFGADEVRPFLAWHVHDVLNAGPELAVSVHVYAPALTVMRRYRRYGDLLVQTTVERAGEDW